jgi:hypothetical protein
MGIAITRDQPAASATRAGADTALATAARIDAGVMIGAGVCANAMRGTSERSTIRRNPKERAIVNLLWSMRQARKNELTQSEKAPAGHPPSAFEMTFPRCRNRESPRPSLMQTGTVLGSLKGPLAQLGGSRRP